jgi:hypothetical protein
MNLQWRRVLVLALFLFGVAFSNEMIQRRQAAVSRLEESSYEEPKRKLIQRKPASVAKKTNLFKPSSEQNSYASNNNESSAVHHGDDAPYVDDMPHSPVEEPRNVIASSGNNYVPMNRAPRQAPRVALNSKLPEESNKKSDPTPAAGTGNIGAGVPLTGLPTAPTPQTPVTETNRTPTAVTFSIDSIAIIEGQLVLKGKNLDQIKTLKMNGNSVSASLMKVSGNASELLAMGLSGIQLAMGKVFNLIISDAYAQATFPIEIELIDGSVTAEKLAPLSAAEDGYVLKWDSIGGRWIPAPDIVGVTGGSGTVTSVTRGVGIAGTGSSITSTGSISVDVGNDVNQIPMFDASKKIVLNNSNTIEMAPLSSISFKDATEEYRLRVDADAFQIWSVVDNAAIMQILGNNFSVNGKSVCLADGTNCPAAATYVTSVGSGAGLIGGPITSSGVLQVDVDNTSIEIASNKVAIKNGGVTAAKLNNMGASVGEVLKWNGTTWMAMADNTGVATETDPNVRKFARTDGSGIVPESCLAGQVLYYDIILDSLRCIALNFSTDNVTEGSTNLYFTDARARAAAVADSISDGVTNIAPSQNAVFDALALKHDKMDATSELMIKTLKLSNGTNWVGLEAPATIASNFILQLPGADGTAGQVLKTDGTGKLGWVDATSGSVTSVTTNPPLSSAGTGTVTISLGYDNITLGMNGSNQLIVKDAGITAAKLNNMGAASGQILKYNGSAWAPAADDGLTAEADPNVRKFARTDGTGIIPPVCTAKQVLRYDSGTDSLVCFNIVLTTDDLAEGATNLFFTDARARTAAVADAIADGVTNIAPSQNAVFDALALKQDMLDGTSELNLKTLKLYNGANYVGFEAPAGATNFLWKLPGADGTVGQVLKTDGAGNLGWVNASSGSVTGIVTNPPLSSAGTGTVTISLGYDDSTIGMNGSNQLIVKDAGVTAAKLNNMGAASGQVLKYNGSAWAPAADAGLTVEADPNVRKFARTDGTGIIPPVCTAKQVLRYDSGTDSLVCFNIALTTDDLAEGATNLFFTDARARTAAVADAIADGVTNIAPSQNAVFDALALKQDMLDGTSELNLKTLKLYNGANYVGLEAPAGATNFLWKLPGADGTVGQVLKTDGTGNLGWVDATAGSVTSVVANPPLSAAGTGVVTLSLGYDNVTIAMNGSNQLILKDGGVTAAKLNSMGAASGQILKWNGSAWAAATDAGISETDVRVFARNGVTGIIPQSCASGQLMNYVLLTDTFECFAINFNTDQVPEGSTNLYYTAARAKAATVADSIVDAVTDVAPSQNAVFDALALKQDLITNTTDLTLRSVRFSNGTNYVALQAPVAIGSNFTWRLPGSDGTVGQVLKTDGSGNLGWMNATDGSVTNVTASLPLSSTGGQTPNLSLAYDDTTIGLNGSNQLIVKDSAITNAKVSATAAIDWSKISKVGAVAGDIGAVPTTRILTAGTGLLGGGDLSADRTFNVDVGTTANKIVQVNGSGKLPVLDGSNLINLPTVWNPNANGIHYTLGNVGIGDNLPTSMLSIKKNQDITVSFSNTNPANVQRTITLSFGHSNGEGATIVADKKTGNNNGNSLNFSTQSTAGGAVVERMRITEDGLVGIGTPTPTQLFHVKNASVTQTNATIGNSSTGSAALCIDPVGGDCTGADFLLLKSNNDLSAEISTAASGGALRLGAAGSLQMTLDIAGNVGIGTTTPGAKFQVGNAADGTEARANAWNAISDERLKKNFEPIPNALDKILSLNGYFYNWKNGPDKSRKMGVKAQEVERVFPEVVSEGSDGFKSVSYDHIIAPVIEAVKELYRKVVVLYERVTASETKIADTNKRVDNLESMMKSGRSPASAQVDSLKAEVSELKAENALLKSYMCKKDPSAPFCK